MRKIQRLITAALLLITALAPLAHGQARKKAAASRRPVKAPAPRRGPKPPPCPASAAITTPSGLTYFITRRGQGPRLRPGETVSVHYTGLLGSGVKFDSSLERGEPIAFELGAGRVIKGWDEGVARLRVGDQATLIVPPDLGYGAKGAGGGIIPGEATLIFIVEVTGVKAGEGVGANPGRR